MRDRSFRKIFGTLGALGMMANGIACGANFEPLKTEDHASLGSKAQALSASAWTALNLVGTKPPARFDHAMAYDPDRNVVLMFGGTIATSGDSELQDTWEWDLASSQWREVGPTTCTLTTCPDKRHGAAMVYDPGNQAMVLFGGHSFTARLQDLWIYKGGQWTPVDQSATTIPEKRHNHTMAYDPVGSGGPLIWLFGGNVNNWSQKDLWALTLDLVPTVPTASWTSLGDAPAAMLSRYAHSMSYMPSKDAFYIFGGKSFDNNTIGTLNDLWKLDRSLTFTELAPGAPPIVVEPGKRYGQVMAAYGEVVVVFGGEVLNNGLSNDTWEGNELAWNQVTPTGTQPIERMSAAMVETPKGLLLFGGHGYVNGPGSRLPMNDTYLYTRSGSPQTDGGSGGDGGSTQDGGSATDGGGPAADAGDPDGGSPEDGGSVDPSLTYSRYGCAIAGGGSAASFWALFVVMFWMLGQAFLRRGSALKEGVRRGSLLKIAAMVSMLGLLLFQRAAVAASEEDKGTNPKKVRLAFVGLETSGGEESELQSSAKGLAEFVQSELGRLGVYDVMGPSEVRGLIGLEKQRRLIGCEESSGCGFDASSVLAASRTLSGSLVQVGARIIMNLSLVDSERARTLGRTARYATKIEELLPMVREALIEIVSKDALVSEELPRMGEGSGSIRASAMHYPGTGMDLSARVDLELLAPGAAGTQIGVATGITAAWRLGRAGLAATLLLQPQALRLAGRFHPVEIWRALPYLEAGISVFLDSVSFRLGGGVGVGIGNFRPFLEVAFERGLTSWPTRGESVSKTYQSSSFLVAGGVGWAF